MKLRQKMLIGSLLPMILLVIGGVVIFNSILFMEKSKKWVNHTNNVIKEAMKIEAAAVDMETGMRGYLLAGKEEFLEPYNAGQGRFFQLTKKLKKTVNDNPPQVKRLVGIEKTIGDWQKNVCEPNIELRRKIGDAETMDDMADEIAKAKGKEFFDKFRGQISKFIQREAELLKKRVASSEGVYTKSTEGIVKVSQSFFWVDHTHKVIEEAMRIESAAVDMETGMRGYLLAGREEFLEPYNAGKERFSTLVKKLQKTVNDNLSQVALLGEISQTISDWDQLVVNTNIALRRKIGDSETMNDMASLVGEAKGKVYFDKFRGEIAEFIKIEDDLMVKRMDDSDSAAASSKNIIIGGFTLI